MNKPFFTFVFGLLTSFVFAQRQSPNVILIMADDMGYECLSTYGSSSYHTPNLDLLAQNGIQFQNCIAQPLCSPSRVKLMTGQYNYRNYEYFGYLNINQKTFGNLMKEAGYATCIAGKWQLNGLNNTAQVTDWNDAFRPKKFGFDEFCLWQLTKMATEGERYADPLIDKNGTLMRPGENAYGPDIFSDFVLDFIENKKNKPFFIYYPMVLVHDPFVPTPDSKAWASPALRKKSDPQYFKDMVTYMDKIVGKIYQKLKEQNLLDNTILIFTADNGTNVQIRSFMQDNSSIQGAKGNTIDAGVHVPLIVHWPNKIKSHLRYNGLIEFSDFYPTFAELTNQKSVTDGKSFYPLLAGKKYKDREDAFVYYDPRWGANVNKYRNCFVQTTDYKLYQDGKFYDIKNDRLEQHPLATNQLNTTQLKTRKKLEEQLNKNLQGRKWVSSARASESLNKN
ncbi:MAG: sulfatase-like hydrolase/transferase [Spirosomataceae bacterium]